MRPLALALALAAVPVGAPRPAGRRLLVYESVTRDSAEVLSTRAPGRAVHFIERVGPSVRVTTLTGCAHRAERNGAMTCIRFAARHAWHFDGRTPRDPDLAFADLPSGAAAGSCEPWQGD